MSYPYRVVIYTFLHVVHHHRFGSFATLAHFSIGTKSYSATLHSSETYLVLFSNYSSETILQKLFGDLQKLFRDLQKLFRIHACFTICRNFFVQA